MDVPHVLGSSLGGGAGASSIGRWWHRGGERGGASGEPREQLLIGWERRGIKFRMEVKEGFLGKKS